MLRPRLLIVTLVLGSVAFVALAQRFRRPHEVAPPETLLPAESALVLIVDGPQAWEQLKPLAQRETWVKRIADAIHNEWQLDLGKDVMTWAGRAAFSVEVTNAYTPLITGVVTIRDYRAAADTITRLRQGYENHGSEFRETSCEGVTIYSTGFPTALGPQYALQAGFAFAQAGGYIIVGNLEPAVRSAIEVMKHKRRQPLVASRDWTQLQPLMPADSSVFIAADLWTLMDKYAALIPMALGDGNGEAKMPTQSELRVRIDRFKSLGWAGIAAEMDSSHLKLSLVGSSRKGPLAESLARAASSPPLKASSLDFVPAETMGWVRFALNPHTREAVNRLGGDAAITSKDRVDEQDRAGPFSALEGEVTLCALPDPAQLHPRLVAIVSAKDATALKASWERAQSDLRKQGYRLQPSQQDDVVLLTTNDAHTMRTALRQLFNWTGELPPALASSLNELAVAQKGNHLWIATSGNALAAAIAAEKKPALPADRNSPPAERQSVVAGYLNLTALTNRYAPDGHVGFFTFKETTDALRTLDGIGLQAQARPSAFRVTVAVNASVVQVSDAVTKSAAPLSVLANMLGIPFNFAGIAGASSLAPPVATAAMAGGGVTGSQQTPPAATNLPAGLSRRPRVPASALPPGALPPAYSDQTIGRARSEMIGSMRVPSTTTMTAPGSRDVSVPMQPRPASVQPR